MCYLCGTLVTAGATSLGGLLAGQFVVGVGVAFSVASNIAYVTEMVPAERSGAMVALYELATTFGIGALRTQYFVILRRLLVYLQRQAWWHSSLLTFA